MSRIILVRHGTPDWDFRTPIAGAALGRWLEGERDAALTAAQSPSAELREVVRGARCVMTSTLRRAIDSARFLFPSVAPTIDARFAEPSLPCAVRSRLRFRPGLWTGLVRTAWFCGWTPGVESFSAARRRARDAAQALVALAADGGDVVLVGHGLMNLLLAARLRTTGWVGPRLRPFRHWGFRVYERA